MTAPSEQDADAVARIATAIQMTGATVVGSVEELHRDFLGILKERNDLRSRRDELLQTIARLSNTVPFPEEWKDWEAQRAAMIAEIGTLRSQSAFRFEQWTEACEQLKALREEFQHRVMEFAAKRGRPAPGSNRIGQRRDELIQVIEDWYDIMRTTDGTAHLPTGPGSPQAIVDAVIALREERRRWA